MVKQNERRLVRHSLLEVNGHYEVDLVKMEQQIIEKKVKLLLFCNPHNPGGRVWTKEELLAIGRLCQKHQVTVVSDEIHQDLIFKPHTFTSFTVADEAFKEFTVTLTAATKTFNLAGIKIQCCSFLMKNYGNLSYLYKTKIIKAASILLATLERQLPIKQGRNG